MGVGLVGGGWSRCWRGYLGGQAEAAAAIQNYGQAGNILLADLLNHPNFRLACLLFSRLNQLHLVGLVPDSHSRLSHESENVANKAVHGLVVKAADGQQSGNQAEKNAQNLVEGWKK